MKKMLMLFVAVLLLQTIVQSQDENPYFKKNSVTADLWHIAGGLNINYERNFKYDFLGAKEIGFKAGYTNGSWIDINNGSGFLFGYNHVITKNHKHALVLNVDITPFTSDVLLGMGAAYRLQTKKGFVMRAGLGFNNSPVIGTLIFGLGYSF